MPTGQHFQVGDIIGVAKAARGNTGHEWLEARIEVQLQQLQCLYQSFSSVSQTLTLRSKIAYFPL